MKTRRKRKILKEDDLKKHVLGFYNAGREPAHRFKSWENCFIYFHWLKAHPNSIARNIDLACLHLGFYLASWGMYRGKSFLLKKSFQVHRKCIKELMKRKYSILWNSDVSSLSNPKSVKLLLTLITRLRKTYDHKMTDTLVTKILLGTMGCVPAYDRYFTEGCKQWNVKPISNFNEQSLLSLIRFYQTNCKMFSQINKQIDRRSIIPYPSMKLLDMFFWSVGSNRNYQKLENAAA